jgi:hypothetical protein
LHAQQFNSPASSNAREAGGECVMIFGLRGVSLSSGNGLSHEQRAQFDAFECFDVTGSKSGKRYRIQHGVSANVHELDDAGHPILGWCFVPAGNLVPGDVMLAQKIALETNESGALSVAQQFLAPRSPFRQ